MDLFLSSEYSSYDSQLLSSSAEQSIAPSTSRSEENDNESELDLDVVFIKEECIYNSDQYDCLEYTQQMKDDYNQAFEKYKAKYSISKAQFDEMFVDLMGIVSKGNKYIQGVVIKYYEEEANELVPAFKTYFENIKEFDSGVLKAVVDSSE